MSDPLKFENQLEKVIDGLSEDELARAVCLLANKLYAVNKGTSKESISAVIRDWASRLTAATRKNRGCRREKKNV